MRRKFQTGSCRPCPRGRHSEGLGAPRACGTAALNYIEAPVCVRHTTSDANRLRWLEGSRRQAAHLEGFKFAIPRVSQVYSSGMPKAVELVRQAFRAYRPRPLTAPDQAWRRQPRPPDEPFSSSLGAQPLSPSVSSLPRSLALSLSLSLSLERRWRFLWSSLPAP